MKSEELNNKRNTLLDEIQTELDKESPDYDVIETKQDEAENLLDQIKTAEKAEKALKEREAIEKKVASSVAGTEASKGEDNELREMSKKFSLGKAVKSIYHNKGLTGVEKEVSDTGRKETEALGNATEGNSIVLPSRFIKIGKKRDLTVATEGADLEFDDYGGFIPALRANPAVVEAGATVFQGLNGDLKLPRKTGVEAFAWEGETDANAETTPTYDNVTLSPKRVGGFVDLSKQLMLQSVFNIEQEVNRSINMGFSVEVDNKAIQGSGSGSIPEGILNVTGIGSSDIGTNGGAITWAAVTGNEKEVRKDNVSGPYSYITNAQVVNAMKTTPKDSGSGSFILPAEVGDALNGYPLYVTENVPNDLTKGTGTALSALIFGRFNDLLIGQWGGFEILFDPYTQATSGMNRMVFNAYLDIKVRHAESFSASDDISAS